MNAAQASPRTGFKFMLTVREGPDAGATFQLLPPRVTIGRGGENNIVLNDPRMSRNAAMIEFSMEKITIVDLSGRQNLVVNGDFCSEASIKDRDVIRIGETEFGFIVEAIPLQPALRSIGPNGEMQMFAPPPQYADPQAGSPPPPRMQTGAAAPNGKIKIYIIAGLLIAFGVWLKMESGKPKGAAGSGIRTVEEIEKEMKASKDKVEELEKKRVFKNQEEKTRFNEAQKHFMEGFRDYQKNSWVRAMRSFETARAIDPQHALAGRYYKLSEKQRDEMIALLTLEGRRYREKMMYTRCSAQFEKVLDMIPNKEDVKYKSAEQFKRECDQLLGGQFQQ